MKNYLSTKEKDVWLVEVLAAAEMEDSLPKMKANLTKDEAKWLKTSVTLRRKAYNSMTSRLGTNAVKQLHKYAINSNIQVVSKSLSNVMTQRELKEQEVTQIDTELLMNLAVSLLAAKCEGCKKNFNSCHIFSMLDEICMEGYCINDNCPYSFGIEEEKKEIKKISKRKQKKMKNKYDDDDEIYEYYFEKK